MNDRLRLGEPVRHAAARHRRRALFMLLWVGAVLLVFHYPTHPAWDMIGVVALALATLAAPLFWPALGGALRDQPMAPLIALVGCDGSGKSTLSHDMCSDFAATHVVRTCYLGLGSGTLGERIKRVPAIGPLVERRLAGKAKQARTRGDRIPGLGTALVVYLFSIVRLRRFRQMLSMRRSGIAVITDRYPQVEVPGFYDGPGLSAARPGSWLVAVLARRERRLYDWMASFEPNVVIRLNVDAETAWARKPDHRYDLLAQKVAATARLRFHGAPIVDVDTVQPYAAVRRRVTQVVQAALLTSPNVKRRLAA